MRKKLLLLVLSLILVGLCSAAQSAAYTITYLGAGDPNSGDAREIEWLEGLPDTPQDLDFFEKVEGWDWNQDIGDNANAQYIILKTGTLKLSDYNFDHFAFEMDGFSSENTWNDVITAMWNELGTKQPDWFKEYVANGHDLADFKGKASHFTMATATVPIPGAVWLLGSGILGLVGIRARFRKKQT